MKSVKQIAFEQKRKPDEIRSKIYSLGLKYSIINKEMYIDPIDEKKLLNYDDTKLISLRKYLAHKRGLLESFLALNALYSIDDATPTGIQQATGIPFHTAKRICQTKEVVAQSKINFGIV